MTTNTATLISSAFKTQGKVCYRKERFLLFLVPPQFSSVSTLLSCLFWMFIFLYQKDLHPKCIHEILFFYRTFEITLSDACPKRSVGTWYTVIKPKDSFVGIFERSCEYILSEKLQNTSKIKSENCTKQCLKSTWTYWFKKINKSLIPCCLHQIHCGHGQNQPLMVNLIKCKFK